MASTIKTEVLTDLNATRKRLHQTASDFIGCNTLTSEVSSYRSIFRARVKSHTSYRKQQHAETNVSMACAKFLNAMKVNRTLLCERDSLTADVADLVSKCTPFAKKTLGMWLERTQCGVGIQWANGSQKTGSIRGGVSAPQPTIFKFGTHVDDHRALMSDPVFSCAPAPTVIMRVMMTRCSLAQVRSRNSHASI